MAEIQSYINRLGKNAKHWGKWARRQGLSCYRIYDQDIPEYPVAVDIYGEHVHLQEYASRWEATEAEHQAWWQSVITATAEVLQVPESVIHGKLRKRQKGDEQYEKDEDASAREFIVEEQGHQFLVNLDTYLDTGLFLDHRNTRRMVQEAAKDKRFLNLFAYTGSFTVYAAAGGATDSVTVDMSNTYQQWSRRNFDLNGMDKHQHKLVLDDVFNFIRDELDSDHEYDLIMLDPPTFSQSKKMVGILDVQRDHPWLIHQCMKLLSTDGEMFFSNNFRKFQLEETLHDWYEIVEISHKTVPEDFRNKKIHRCWHISHKQ
ncbi:MAG: class I SAM-dependent methyltransferase [Gammaproteobacteria bacterium]|nr:class I SAM-dependent methyltransferase [Gammaproteobacteria bacterium]